MPSEAKGLEFFSYAPDNIGELLFSTQSGLTDGVTVALGGYLLLMIVALAFLIIGVSRLVKKVRLYIPAEPKIGAEWMLGLLFVGGLISCMIIVEAGLLNNLATAISLFLSITGLAALAGFYAAGIRLTPVRPTR